MRNDYKLRLIGSFWDDHVPKHINDYRACMTSTGIENMSTTVDKERAFADCHREWVRDFKDNQSQNLEMRARQLLGRGFD